MRVPVWVGSEDSVKKADENVKKMEKQKGFKRASNAAPARVEIARGRLAWIVEGTLPAEEEARKS